MKVGDLLVPKVQTGGQLHIPFWSDTVALVVAKDYCVDCDFGEQTPVEERLRWVILSSGELLFMTPFLVEQCYDCG